MKDGGGGIITSIKSFIVNNLFTCSRRLPSLVIDLDNTLIYSTALPTSKHYYECDVCKKKYFVHVRPGATEFLEKVSDLYEIFIFTASSKEYSENIIKHIFPSVNIQNCFFRESCIFKLGYALKDLKVINRPLNQVVLVDDILGSGMMQPGNTVCVEPWIGNFQDSVLLNELYPFLLSCAEENNIPKAIHKYAEKMKPKHLSFFCSV